MPQTPIFPLSIQPARQGGSGQATAALALLLCAGCPGSGTTSDASLASDLRSADARTADASQSDGAALDNSVADVGGPSADGAGADTSAPDAGPQPDALAPFCAGTNSAVPRDIELPTTASNGVFDPSVAGDPSTSRVWMTYTTVDGPAGSGPASTHLAYTDDSGDTWCGYGVLNETLPVPMTQQPPGIAKPEARWQHETSAIVFDPDAPADARWRVIWIRYLHIEDNIPGNDDRHFEHSWIAQRRSATAEGLLSAPEEKLFTAFPYHGPSAAYNASIVTPTVEQRLDQLPTMNSCAFVIEPGMVAEGGKLYVAIACARVGGTVSIELLQLDHSTSAWSFAGTLLTAADGAAINPAISALNAPELFMLGGAARLLATPVVNDTYRGCLIYRVDLAAGTTGAVLPVAVPANASPSVPFNGACTFVEGLNTGVISSDAHATAPQFNVSATGVVPQ